MKLSTKLLKEIYNSVDENLKAKIEIEVPEIKPSLEVGRWYKWNDSENNTNVLINITNINRRKICAYGFVNNEFKHNCIFYSQKYNREAIENLTLATPEEVKTALVDEAKRRGFTFGKCFKELKDEENGSLFNKSGKCGKFFEFKNNKLFVIGYGRWKVFDNGNWATIVTEPTKKELLQKQVDELKRQIDLL